MGLTSPETASRRPSAPNATEIGPAQPLISLVVRSAAPSSSSKDSWRVGSPVTYASAPGSCAAPRPKMLIGTQPAAWAVAEAQTGPFGPATALMALAKLALLVVPGSVSMSWVWAYEPCVSHFQLMLNTLKWPSAPSMARSEARVSSDCAAVRNPAPVVPRVKALVAFAA